jgi:hypothetical protein
MSKNKTTNLNNSIILMAFLGVLLAIFKRIGAIPLSWAWVLAPIWIPASLLIIAVIFGFVIAIVEHIKE